jgi:hypothetical protein
MYMEDNQQKENNPIKKCHGLLCREVSWYDKWHKSSPDKNTLHLFILSALIIFFLQYNFPGITNKVTHIINGASVDSSSPEDITPAPVEETPAPEDSTSAPVEETPAPEDSTSAPVEETPAPQEEAPASPAEETSASEETIVPPSEEVPAIIPVTLINPDPVVRSISSPIIKGTFHSGVVPIIVVFNKAVEVTGTPQLILSTGTPSTTAVALKYAFGNRLYFLYHIAGSNSTSDLDYDSSSAIDLNGGSIRDLSGNDADLTLPEPGSPGSLSGKGQIVIETEEDTI